MSKEIQPQRPNNTFQPSLFPFGEAESVPPQGLENVSSGNQKGVCPYTLDFLRGKVIEITGVKNINTLSAPVCFAVLSHVIHEQAKSDGGWKLPTVMAVKEYFRLLLRYEGTARFDDFVEALQSGGSSLRRQGELTEILSGGEKKPAEQNVDAIMRLVQSIYLAGQRLGLAVDEIKNEKQITQVLQIADRITGDPQGQLPVFLGLINGTLEERIAAYIKDGIDAEERETQLIQSIVDAPVNDKGYLSVSPFSPHTYILFEKVWDCLQKIQEEQIHDIVRGAEGRERQRRAHSAAVRKAQEINMRAGNEVIILNARGEGLTQMIPARKEWSQKQVEMVGLQLGHIVEILGISSFNFGNGVSETVGGLVAGTVRGAVYPTKELLSGLGDLSGVVLEGAFNAGDKMIAVTFRGVGGVAQTVFIGFGELIGLVTRGIVEFPDAVKQGYRKPRRG